MSLVHGRDSSLLRTRVSSVRQLFRIDKFVEDDGPERGSRRFRLINGGGLEVDIHPDRGLDIGSVSYRGVPLAWSAAAGIVAPWFYDPHGDGWLRTFGGGLITTCGLETFGPPSEDDGRAFGQHGRFSAIPGRVSSAIEGPEELIVAGQVRQSAHFGENFVVQRTIRSPIGSSAFRVEDTVTNESSEPQPHMFMYHLNVGWPLLDTGVTVRADASAVSSRDGEEVRHADWALVEDSTPSGNDKVWLHTYSSMRERREVVVTNKTLGLELSVSYSAATLPWLCQWKCLNDNAYVLGIEPINTPTMAGRADAHQRGVLPVLGAGESVDYSIEVHARELL